MPPPRAFNDLYCEWRRAEAVAGLRSQPFTPNEAVFSEINSSLTTLPV
jgi:hypothetical protein